MTSLTSDRPMPVVPAASDPHGPVIVKYTASQTDRQTDRQTTVIVKYTVLASYLITFVLGLVGNTLVIA